MGSGYRTFAAGEVATSSNVMNYLMKQAVMSFATAAARTAAISAPEEGMFTYQQDTDTYYMYTGAAWLVVASGLGWQGFTPTWSGSTSNPTLNNGTLSSSYLQVGKTVRFRINLTWGSTTAAGSGAYGFTLPLAPLTDQTVSAVVVDTSAALRFACSAWLTAASGVFRIVPPTDAGSAGVAGTVPVILATGDQIIISGTYETA
jgi:hypothetical protein